MDGHYTFGGRSDSSWIQGIDGYFARFQFFTKFATLSWPGRTLESHEEIYSQDIDQTYRKQEDSSQTVFMERQDQG